MQHNRFVFCLLMTTIFTACSSTGPAAVVMRGGLQVQVSGNPDGTTPKILVTGPEAYSRTLSGTEELGNLLPGIYTVTAEPLDFNSLEYIAASEALSVNVVAGATAISTLPYRLSGNGVTYAYRFTAQYNYQFKSEETSVETDALGNYINRTKQENVLKQLSWNCLTHEPLFDSPSMPKDACNLQINGAFNRQDKFSSYREDVNFRRTGNGLRNARATLEQAVNNASQPYYFGIGILRVTFGQSLQMVGNDSGTTSELCVPLRPQGCAGDGESSVDTAFDDPFTYPFATGVTLDDIPIKKDQLISISGVFPDLPTCVGSEIVQPGLTGRYTCTQQQSGSWSLNRQRVTVALAR